MFKPEEQLRLEADYKWSGLSEGFSISKAKAAVRSLPAELRHDKGVRTAAMLSTRRFYHGTKSVFDKVDPALLNRQSLFGPGFYTTDSLDIAHGYAETVRGSIPNIRMISATPQRTMKLKSNRPMDRHIMNKLYLNKRMDYSSKLAAHAGDNKEALKILRSNAGKFMRNLRAHRNGEDQFLTMLRTYIELDGPEGTANLIGSLNKIGFDSIAHLGGWRTASKPHRVLIDTTGENVRTLGITAPGLLKPNSSEPVRRLVVQAEALPSLSFPGDISPRRIKAPGNTYMQRHPEAFRNPNTYHSFALVDVDVDKVSQLNAKQAKIYHIRQRNIGWEETYDKYKRQFDSRTQEELYLQEAKDYEGLIQVKRQSILQARAARDLKAGRVIMQESKGSAASGLVTSIIGKLKGARRMLSHL